MFAVIVASIFPKYLDSFLTTLNEWLLKKKLYLFKYLTLFVLAIISIISLLISYNVITNKFYISERRSRRFGLELNKLIFPEKAADFIKKVRLSGNLFNNYDAGAYLNWQLYPKHLSFIDGRNNSYDISFLENYFKVMAGIISYQDIVDTYNIKFFFLSHKAKDTGIIIRKLYNDPDWSLIYFDELSTLFAKNDDVNKSIINDHKIDFKTGKNFTQEVANIKNTAELFVARNLRGEFFLNLGILELAEFEFQKALDIYQDGIVYNNLGVVYQRLGRINEAIETFKKATGISKDFAPAYFNLGNLYSNKASWQEARNHYEHGLRLDPSFSDAYLNLGVIYKYYLPDLTKAVKYWRKYLELAPMDFQAEVIRDELKTLRPPP